MEFGETAELHVKARRVSVDSTSLGEQFDSAASALESGLLRNDLTGFFEIFRNSDLPFLPQARRNDTAGLARTLCSLLHRLGGISPAVTLAVENHFYVTSALATIPIQESSLKARRQSLFRDLKRGRLLVANTNSHVHADRLGSFGVVARRERDGFQVTGSAAYMSLATQGDLLVFLSGIEDEGLGLFVTSLRNNPSVKVGPLLFPHAMVDSDTRRVSFHDLVLSKRDLLISGAPEQISQVLLFQLVWHQLLLAALYLGAAARAIEEVRLFLRSVRTVNDRPLAELDGMVVDTGRLVLRYHTAWALVERVTEGLGRISRHALERESLDELFCLASAAKHTGTTFAEEIVTIARRIVGARTFTGGHPLERLSQEAIFGPLGPEVNAAVERRLGRRALGDEAFLAGKP